MSETEKQLQELLIAVVQIEKTQEATIKAQDVTTKNVDKLVGHMENMLPFHEQLKSMNNRVKDLEDESKGGIRPQTLKGLLVGGVVIIIAFAGWLSLDHLALKEKYDKHDAAQTQAEKALKDEIKKNNENSSKDRNDNKNQITYLKGSKLDKPKR